MTDKKFVKADAQTNKTTFEYHLIWPIQNHIIIIISLTLNVILDRMVTTPYFFFFTFNILLIY